ncbi:hypothetical protein VOLCADRAFT_119092, partial [Volvox carteri f. nagariensis]
PNNAHYAHVHIRCQLPYIRRTAFLAAAGSAAAASGTTSPDAETGRLAPGLYGLPGLHSPDDLISLAARIVAHCQELQLCMDLLAEAQAQADGCGALPYASSLLSSSPSSSPSAAAAAAAAATAQTAAVDDVAAARTAAAEVARLVRRHHEAVSWLRPAAEHCAEHHAEGQWREAAGRALRAMQAVEELLAMRLAAHSSGPGGHHQHHQQAAVEAAESAIAPPPHCRRVIDAERGGGGERSISTRGSGGGPEEVVATGGDAAGARRDQLEGRVGGSMEAVAATAAGGGGGGGGQLRLVSEAVSRAAALSEQDRQERAALERLETRLIAAFRAALSDPRVTPVPLVVLHDSEVRGDPLLARHVTPATEAEVAAARAGESVTLPLVLPPDGYDGGGGGGGDGGGSISNGGGSGGGEGSTETSAATAGYGEQVAKIELGPVAAMTRRARRRGGRLWALRLTGALTGLLLAEHPSSQVRRAVHAVTHGSQASAALRFLDLMRPLRDRLADCLQQPSYAHLKMAGDSVAGDPRVALMLLYDILSAVRPLAEEEVAALQRLQMQMLVEVEGGEAEEELVAAGGGGGGSGGCSGVEQGGDGEGDVYDSDPLHLRGSVDFLVAVRRNPPLSAREWRELAPYFSIEGLLQGLSRQLSHVFGLGLRVSPPVPPNRGECQPGEFWRHPDSIVRLELREASGSSSGSSSGSGSSSNMTGSGRTDGPVPGELLGVLYVYLDPDCDLPYTVLISGGICSWCTATLAPHGGPFLTPREWKGSRPQTLNTPHAPPWQARVRGVTHGSGAGAGGYLVPEHPGLIRTLVHELGHALHYMMSYSPGALPDSNACYSSTDYLELVSHILERWFADPWVLSQLSCHVVSGARLPPRLCAAVAATPSRHTTWLELQQHCLAAAADLLMNLNGHLDVQRLRLVPQPPDPQPPQTTAAPQPPPAVIPNPSTRQGTAPSAQPPPPPPRLIELQSTPTLELVSALWAEHSALPGGVFQPTRGLMTVLPGFLHNAAVMYAYPAAQLVAVAVWERHFAAGSTAAAAAAASGEGPLESAAAARCGRLIRRCLLEQGNPAAAAAALEALLGPGSVRRVRLARDDEHRNDESSCGVGVEAPGEFGDLYCRVGVIPDLAHAAFQDVDPLVF